MNHWFLAVICNPVNEPKHDSILIFDSIGGYHETAVKLIKDYLTEERRKKINVICTDHKIVIVDVPKQNNCYDCGVYMLQYAESFCLTALSIFFQEAAIPSCAQGPHGAHFGQITPCNTPATPPNFPDALLAFSKMSAGEKTPLGMSPSQNGLHLNQQSAQQRCSSVSGSHAPHHHLHLHHQQSTAAAAAGAATTAAAHHHQQQFGLGPEAQR